GPPEFAFSGLISASKEEGLEEARRSLRSPTRVARLILARGRSSNGCLRTCTDGIEVPLPHTWVDAAELLGAVISDTPDYAACEIALDRATTFLAAMRNAALCPQPVFRCPFVHGGKLYALTTHRRSNAPTDMTGVIRNSLGQKSAEFRAVYEANDDS